MLMNKSVFNERDSDPNHLQKKILPLNSFFIKTLSFIFEHAVALRKQAGELCPASLPADASSFMPSRLD
jgi:hypothetical protein